MNYTENERNMLKLIGFFASGKQLEYEYWKRKRRKLQIFIKLGNKISSPFLEMGKLD